MSTLAGGDVSHWQTGISLGATGWDFAIFKATDGTNYVDGTCDGFVSQAKKAGMKWGVYHFYEGGGAAEAKFFVEHVGGYVGGGLLVLDFETHTSDVAGAKAWLDYVYDATGVRPVIYMNHSVLTSNDWSGVAKDYGLWFARYADSTGAISPWKNLTLWQYTSSGRGAGYSGSLDLDRFYGSHATWDALAQGSAPAPDPDPPQEDEMKYAGYESTTTHALPNGQWRTVAISDDGDLTILIRRDPGATIFTATAHLTLEGLPTGKQVEVQFIAVDYKAGEDTEVAQAWPSVEITGTPGKTIVGVSQVGELKAPAAGYSRRLRMRIVAWDDGVSLTSAQARLLYQ